MLTLSQSLDDQGEGEETQEQYVQLFEAGEDSAEAFETAEEPLDLIAFAVHGFVVLPGLQPIAFGWDHGNKAEIQRQLPGFAILVGPVHDQVQGCG